MNAQPDLSSAAAALEEVYEKIADDLPDGTEIQITVSWVSPGGQPMALSVGETSPDDDEDDDLDYDADDDLDPDYIQVPQ